MKPSEILSSEETLFRNQEVFNPGYIPDQFRFRESQIKEMTYCLRPAISGGRPSSAFIIGDPATGKTTSVRIIFDQLRESTNKVIPVYVNCHLRSSAYKIISEIRKAVIGFYPPDTGIPITRVQDEVFQELAEKGKSLVVCLDDINYLFSNDMADDVLYTLLRAHESYPGVRTCVFAVSTEEVLHRLDQRVRSIFSPVRVEFPSYGSGEVFEILKARRDHGLYPGVLKDPLLKRIASLSKDLRFGIELVKQSALTAEADASKRVTSGHVEKAVKSLKPPEASNEKMVVLSLVREKGPIESGKLFSLAKEHVDISYTSFYRMLKKLQAGGFLEIESVAKDRGRTSLIRAK